jgi:hypothetical protein
MVSFTNKWRYTIKWIPGIMKKSVILCFIIFTLFRVYPAEQLKRVWKKPVDKQWQLWVETDQGIHAIGNQEYTRLSYQSYAHMIVFQGDDELFFWNKGNLTKLADGSEIFPLAYGFKKGILVYSSMKERAALHGSGTFLLREGKITRIGEEYTSRFKITDGPVIASSNKVLYLWHEGRTMKLGTGTNLYPVLYQYKKGQLVFSCIERESSPSGYGTFIWENGSVSRLGSEYTRKFEIIEDKVLAYSSDFLYLWENGLARELIWGNVNTPVIVKHRGEFMVFSGCGNFLAPRKSEWGVFLYKHGRLIRLGDYTDQIKILKNMVIVSSKDYLSLWEGGTLTELAIGTGLFPVLFKEGKGSILFSCGKCPLFHGKTGTFLWQNREIKKIGAYTTTFKFYKDLFVASSPEDLYLWYDDTSIHCARGNPIFPVMYDYKYGILAYSCNTPGMFPGEQGTYIWQDGSLARMGEYTTHFKILPGLAIAHSQKNLFLWDQEKTFCLAMGTEEFPVHYTYKDSQLVFSCAAPVGKTGTISGGPGTYIWYDDKAYCIGTYEVQYQIEKDLILTYSAKHLDIWQQGTRTELVKGNSRYPVFFKYTGDALLFSGYYSPQIPAWSEPFSSAAANNNDGGGTYVWRRGKVTWLGSYMTEYKIEKDFIIVSSKTKLKLWCNGRVIHLATGTDRFPVHYAYDNEMTFFAGETCPPLDEGPGTYLWHNGRIQKICDYITRFDMYPGLTVMSSLKKMFIWYNNQSITLVDGTYEYHVSYQYKNGLLLYHGDPQKIIHSKIPDYYVWYQGTINHLGPITMNLLMEDDFILLYSRFNAVLWRQGEILELGTGTFEKPIVFQYDQGFLVFSCAFNNKFSQQGTYVWTGGEVFRICDYARYFEIYPDQIICRLKDHLFVWWNGQTYHLARANEWSSIVHKYAGGMLVFSCAECPFLSGSRGTFIWYEGMVSKIGEYSRRFEIYDNKIIFITGYNLNLWADGTVYTLATGSKYCPVSYELKDGQLIFRGEYCPALSYGRGTYLWQDGCIYPVGEYSTKPVMYKDVMIVPPSAPYNILKIIKDGVITELGYGSTYYPVKYRYEEGILVFSCENGILLPYGPGTYVWQDGQINRIADYTTEFIIEPDIVIASSESILSVWWRGKAFELVNGYPEPPLVYKYTDGTLIFATADCRLSYKGQGTFIWRNGEISRVGEYSSNFKAVDGMIFVYDENSLSLWWRNKSIELARGCQFFPVIFKYIDGKVIFSCDDSRLLSFGTGTYFWEMGKVSYIGEYADKFEVSNGMIITSSPEILNLWKDGVVTKLAYGCDEYPIHYVMAGENRLLFSCLQNWISPNGLGTYVWQDDVVEFIEEYRRDLSSLRENYF